MYWMRETVLELSEMKTDSDWRLFRYRDFFVGILVCYFEKDFIYEGKMTSKIFLRTMRV